MSCEAQGATSQQTRSTYELPAKLCLSTNLPLRRYRTAFAGKWHLGFARRREFPAKRGFDASDGIVGSSHDHFNWTVHREDFNFDANGDGELESDGTGGVADERNVDYFITGEDGELLPIGPADVPRGQFSSDVFAASAERRIRAHFGSPSHKDKPLYFYVATTAPHQPLMAPDSDLKHVLDARLGGQPFDGGLPLTSHPYFGGCPWKSADQNGPCTADEARPRLAYEAMVRSVDRLLDRLETTLLDVGQWNDTLLVFSSDNGGDQGHCQKNQPLRGNKGSFFDGGIRVVAGIAGGFLPPHFRGRAADTLVHQSDMCARRLTLRAALICSRCPSPMHSRAAMRASPTSLGWVTASSTRQGRAVRTAMTQTASTWFQPCGRSWRRWLQVARRSRSFESLPRATSPLGLLFWCAQCPKAILMLRPESGSTSGDRSVPAWNKTPRCAGRTFAETAGPDACLTCCLIPPRALSYQARTMTLWVSCKKHSTDTRAGRTAQSNSGPSRPALARPTRSITKRSAGAGHTATRPSTATSADLAFAVSLRTFSTKGLCASTASFIRQLNSALRHRSVMADAAVAATTFTMWPGPLFHRRPHLLRYHHHIPSHRRHRLWPRLCSQRRRLSCHQVRPPRHSALRELPTLQALCCPRHPASRSRHDLESPFQWRSLCY